MLPFTTHSQNSTLFQTYQSYPTKSPKIKIINNFVTTSVFELELPQHEVRPGPAQVRRGAGEEAGLAAQARTGADSRGDELHAARRRHLGQVSVCVFVRVLLLLLQREINRRSWWRWWSTFRPIPLGLEKERWLIRIALDAGWDVTFFILFFPLVILSRYCECCNTSCNFILSRTFFVGE